MGGDRRVGALDAHHLCLTQRRRAPDEPCRGCAEHHPARRRDGFHPLRKAYLFSDCGVTQSPRTDLTGNDLTGVQSHAHLQIQTVALFHVRGQSDGFILNAQRRTAGANGVVFQRHRRTEHCHDPVAGELCDCGAVTLHHLYSAVGEFGHDFPEPLRPDGRGDVHRVDHISEENRDLLVLGVRVACFDWCAARVAKPGAR